MPNNEYINKIAACNEINRFTGYLDDDMICRLQIALNRIPTADVEPVRHGRWINAYPKKEQNPMFNYGTCSICGFEQNISNKLNFCPNCGAKMDKEEEND